MSFASSYLISYTCSLTVFLGLIFYLQAFREDFANIFQKLDQTLNNNKISIGMMEMKSKSILYESFKMQEMFMRYDLIIRYQSLFCRSIH